MKSLENALSSPLHAPICIIPARAGSKRIKGKNIRIFRGKPMIEWSIQAALNSGLFDRVVVSTDSYEISSISRNAGAEVPFIRPSSLSDDFTGTREVIEHAIDQLSLQDAAMLPICCLYATAPFVLPLDLTQAYELLHNSELSTVVFTAASFSTPIQRALRIDSKGYSFAYDTDAINKRSQDLETFTTTQDNSIGRLSQGGKEMRIF